jgi:hypothetical protein
MTGFVRKQFRPDMPKASASPVKAPLVPTIDEARQSEEDLMRLRRRRGIISTMLTRMFGRQPAPTSASPSIAGVASAATTGAGAGTGSAERSYAPRYPGRQLSR